MTNYKPHDKVWAKVKSFPWWPGTIPDMEQIDKDLIKELKTKENEIIVYFPDTNNYSNVSTAFVIDYETGRDQHAVISKNKSKKFIKALEDFEKEYQKDKGDDYVPLKTSETPKNKATATPKTPKATASKAKESAPTPVATPEVTNSQASPKKAPTPAPASPEKSPEKKPTSAETPKSAGNANAQWSNTTKAKDYTRTPFGTRKRAATNTPSSPAVNDKPASASAAPEPVKKAKFDDEVAKPDSTEGLTAAAVGVIGSGSMYETIVRLLAQNQTIIYQAKAPIGSQTNFKSDPIEIAANGKFIFLYFDTLAESESLFFGPNNGAFYKALTEGKFVINLTPFNPENSKQIENHVTQTGSKYIECCPFLTKPEDFQSKNFPMVVAGPDFQQVKPSIQALTKKIHNVGKEIGKACIIVNALTILNVGSSALLKEFCSSLNSNGVDTKTTGDILSDSVLSSIALNSWIGTLKKNQGGLKAIPAILNETQKEDVQYRMLEVLKADSNNAEPSYLIATISQMIKK